MLLWRCIRELAVTVSRSGRKVGRSSDLRKVIPWPQQGAQGKSGINTLRTMASGSHKSLPPGHELKIYHGADRGDRKQVKGSGRASSGQITQFNVATSPAKFPKEHSRQRRYGAAHAVNCFLPMINNRWKLFQTPRKLFRGSINVSFISRPLLT